MKKKLMLVVAVLSTLTACLKEEMRSSDTAENYYRGVAQVRSGLNGCYSPMRSILATRGFWLMTDADTDVMYLAASTAYDANCEVSPARPSAASIIWSNGYLGVMRCNEILADIDAAVDGGYLTEAESLPLCAEASVLRVMYYYLLTSTFGDVPFYTEKVTEENRARIACLPRMDADDTRAFCMEEMRYWMLGQQALPLERTYASGYRAGAALGLMLGAKCALWNGAWQEAVDFIEALEDIYGRYDTDPEAFGVDYPLADVPFSVKYPRESIWELGNLVESYGLQTSGLIASSATPTRRIVGQVSTGEEDEGTEQTSDYYDGIAVPELGGYARTSTAARPTAYFYQQLLPYIGADLRSGEYSNSSAVPRGGSGTLAWRWSGYDLVADPARQSRQVLFFWFGGSKAGTYTARPWLGNKFWCFGMYNMKDANNYRFFRFADALLMKAEALLRLEDYDAACRYLNITRVRAALAPVTFAGVRSDPDALLEEIRKERARELYGEFQRKFDLVRWGIWYERTLAYNESRYLQDNIRPCHRYWPIPADQVSYSGNALDNAEYAE